MARKHAGHLQGGSIWVARVLTVDVAVARLDDGVLAVDLVDVAALAGQVRLVVLGQSRRCLGAYPPP